jgi:hypothetical protein
MAISLKTGTVSTANLATPLTAANAFQPTARPSIKTDARSALLAMSPRANFVFLKTASSSTPFTIALIAQWGIDWSLEAVDLPTARSSTRLLANPVTIYSTNPASGYPSTTARYLTPPAKLVGLVLTVSSCGTTYAGTSVIADGSVTLQVAPNACLVTISRATYATPSIVSPTTTITHDATAALKTIPSSTVYVEGIFTNASDTITIDCVCSAITAITSPNRTDAWPITAFTIPSTPISAPPASTDTLLTATPISASRNCPIASYPAMSATATNA